MKKKFINVLLLALCSGILTSCADLGIKKDDDVVAVNQENSIDVSGDDSNNTEGDVVAGSDEAEKSQATTSNNVSEATNKQVVRNYRLFFYDAVTDSIYYENRNLTVTDDAVVKALTEGLKNSEKFDTISSDTGVTNASLDLENNTITVNLSADYYDILSKVGSGPELKLLQSVALTYGYNYDVDKVIILIDGKPYVSGHLEFADGEYIDISTINTFSAS